jgi:hypothetical protein
VKSSFEPGGLGDELLVWLALRFGRIPKTERNALCSIDAKMMLRRGEIARTEII